MRQREVDREALAIRRPVCRDSLVHSRYIEEAILEPPGMLALEPQGRCEDPRLVFALLVVRPEHVVAELRQLDDGTIGARKPHEAAVNPTAGSPSMNVVPEKPR